MYQAVRRGIHELGLFEDIIQDGQVRRGIAGLWFSETADIWNDNRPPFDMAKRTLYIAIRHQQLPLDVVVDGDELKDYAVMYLADQHVSRAGAKALVNWVNAGGRLFATAGAGMFDEFNQPNVLLRELFGIEPQIGARTALSASSLSGSVIARTRLSALRSVDRSRSSLLEAKEPLRFEKQDLPFAEPLETVRWRKASMPVFGAYGRIIAKAANVEARFSDGSPALTVKSNGKGAATYCSFLPGLTYFKPALPLRPVDRSSRDDSLAHWIPTQFDAGAFQLIGSVADIERPVAASEPLVETTLIEAPQGAVISLNNWRSKPVRNLTLTLNAPLSFSQSSLASGKPVRVSRKSSPLVFTLDLEVADALILRH